MSEEQIETRACEDCLHYFACRVNSEYVPTPCCAYENKAGYRKQSEWISVEVKLPEKEGTYLTYTDKDKMIIDVFCIYPSHETKFWVGGNGEATHWMPLPEPPKMKGGAE